MPEDKLLALPGSSWETVKRIIRAFSAVQNDENPKVEEIAKLAGVPRPVVSMNNGFLRSVGIVRPDQWKLTDGGRRYVTGLQMANESMAAESLAETARLNPTIAQLLNLLMARGGVKTDTFKGEVMLRLGVNPANRQAQFIKPLFDMLVEAKLIQIADDVVSLVIAQNSGNARGGGDVPIVPPPPPPPPPPPAQGLPILLGPNRLAYIQLPNDWDKKDLPKLVKMLQLALGDDTE